jgi:OOP family OmpA-OmpF porin
MKMTFYKNTTLLAAGLSVVLAAHAESQEKVWYVNPAIGYQSLDNDRGLDDETVLSLGTEYRYSKHWATEIRLMDSSPDYENSNGDVDLSQYGIDGLYYFGSEGKVDPYMAVGVGHAKFDGSGNTDNETQLDMGLGLRYYLSPLWSLRADAKMLYGHDDSTRDNLFALGLSYAFDGQTKAAPAAPVDGDSDKDGVTDSNDQCPDTTAGAVVDVRGCELDTDGDGVIDSQDKCPDTPAGRQVDEHGCEYVLTQTEKVTLNVNFASDSSVVTEQYVGEVEKVAMFLKKYASVTAVIEGHTDNTGNEQYNEALSQRRADAVRSMLVQRFGIAEQRLMAKGYGETQAIESNDTAEGRLANRRVVAVMKAETTK